MTEYEAGRDLDALIAERVMGLVPGVDFGLHPKHQWKWNDYSTDGTMMCTWCWESSQAWVDPVAEDIDPEIDALPCDQPPIRYSTAIAAAWQVWEWICAHAPDEITPIMVGGQEPRVAFMNWYWDGGAESANSPTNPGIDAPTWPLAICMAALMLPTIPRRD